MIVQTGIDIFDSSGVLLNQAGKAKIPVICHFTEKKQGDGLTKEFRFGNEKAFPEKRMG